METRKDIGQALKESFSKYKDSPNDFVWEQIELNLKKKKKKKKPFIFWFQYGSVALILLLLLLQNKDDILNFREVKIPSDEKHLEKNNLSEKSSNNGIKLSDKKNLNENNLLIEEKSSDDGKSTESNNKIISSNYNSSYSNTKTSKKSTYLSKNHKLSSKTNEKLDLENDSQNTIKNITQYNSINPDDKKYVNRTFDSIQKTLNDSIISNEKLVDNQVHKDSESKKNDSIFVIDDKKWSVYPNASIVYYDGFNKSFENQISFSYGLYLVYHASNKFDFRIGVNKLNLQQSFKDNDSLIIQQNVEYLEIPLELRYNFSNKKIKSHIVAGFSYLILDESFTSTSENNFSTNDFNNSIFNESTISLNIGFSFQTKIYKNFNFNIEPLFKFHLKPFNAASEFNPYTISISTGIEYKF